MLAGAGTGAAPSACVELPTTTKLAEGASETGVFETVIAGPPATRVWEPMMKAVAELAVKGCPPT